MASERLSLQSDALTTQAVVMGELLNAAMEPALALHGLKPATFDLLSTIHAVGSMATQAEIARRLGMKPPSLTEALRGLKHFIEQVPSDSDSRVKHLVLTDRGRTALAGTIRSVEAVSQTITKGIERSQLAVAIDVLKRANRLLAQNLANSR